MKHEFVIDGQPVDLELKRAGTGWIATFPGGPELRVRHWTPGHLLLDDGTSVEYGRAGEQVSVLGELLTVRLAEQVAAEAAAGAGDGRVAAPMNGQVVKLLREPGQAVNKGEVVLVLEAMKMENEVSAPRDGLLQGIEVRVGQTVSPGDLLFTVTENGVTPCP